MFPKLALPVIFKVPTILAPVPVTTKILEFEFGDIDILPVTAYKAITLLEAVPEYIVIALPTGTEVALGFAPPIAPR